MLQFPHNRHKLIQRICAIDAKITVLEHHEVAIILSTLRLPFTAKLQLAGAVAVIPVITFILNQHQLSGLGHYHEVRIMVDKAIQPEALLLNDSVPPFDIVEGYYGVDQLMLAFT